MSGRDALGRWESALAAAETTARRVAASGSAPVEELAAVAARLAPALAAEVAARRVTWAGVWADPLAHGPDAVRLVRAVALQAAARLDTAP